MLEEIIMGIFWFWVVVGALGLSIAIPALTGIALWGIVKSVAMELEKHWNRMTTPNDDLRKKYKARPKRAKYLGEPVGVGDDGELIYYIDTITPDPHPRVRRK